MPQQPTDLKYTPLADIPKIVSQVQDSARRGAMKDIKFRKQQLRAMSRLLKENESDICEALYQDLGKDPKTALFTEIMLCNNEIHDAIENLDSWVEPRNAKGDPVVNMFDTVQIRPQPLGACLIIGAWNYPIQLTLGPLVACITAGNCAVLKPSEVSQSSAKVMADLVPKYLDNSCFKVVNGAVPETTALLNEKFDHIFYTGNGAVGKIVMAAAAKHLTPVTLELGGKSPVYIDKDMDAKVAAKRIYWAKSVNSGQTCIAPDYILCHKDKVNEFVEGVRLAMKQYYDGDEKKSEFYSKIVNSRHFDRVSNVLKSQLSSNPNTKVVIGGLDQSDKENLHFPTTVLTNVGKDPEKNPIMKEEIFGSLLPIITVSGPDEAIDYINSREKPLSLYAFSQKTAVIEKIFEQTSSGGVVGNDLMMNMAISTIPFGGVGPSGMGSYHGKFGFDNFSHLRSTLIRPAGMEFLNELRYPPFTDTKVKILKGAIGKNVSATDHHYVVVKASQIFSRYLVSMAMMGICLGLGYLAGRDSKSL